MTRMTPEDALREAMMATIPPRFRPRPIPTPGPQPRVRPAADRKAVAIPSGPLVAPRRLVGRLPASDQARAAERAEWVCANIEAGRTRREIAAALRVGPSTVGRIERGTPMTILTQADIADVAEIRAPRERLRCALVEVSAATGVPIREIMGKSRIQRIVRARQLVCHVLRRQGMSHSQIGAVMGIDRTTAIHSVRAIEARRARIATESAAEGFCREGQGKWAKAAHGRKNGGMIE